MVKQCAYCGSGKLVCSDCLEEQLDRLENELKKLVKDELEARLNEKVKPKKEE